MDEYERKAWNSEEDRRQDRIEEDRKQDRIRHERIREVERREDYISEENARIDRAYRAKELEYRHEQMDAARRAGDTAAFLHHQFMAYGGPEPPAEQLRPATPAPVPTVSRSPDGGLDARKAEVLNLILDCEGLSPSPGIYRPGDFFLQLLLESVSGVECRVKLRWYRRLLHTDLAGPGASSELTALEKEVFDLLMRVRKWSPAAGEVFSAVGLLPSDFDRPLTEAAVERLGESLCGIYRGLSGLATEVLKREWDRLIPLPPW